MRRALVFMCVGFVFPIGLSAQELVTSPRPQARSVAASTEPVASGTAQSPATDVVLSEQVGGSLIGGSLIDRSPRPKAHPNPWANGTGPDAQNSLASADMTQVPVDQAPAQSKPEKKSKKGSVCGDPSIKGEKLARITSKVKGCGVEAPVRVTSIDGIQLSQPATMDCDTAIALKSWIRDGLRPALRQREVVELSIAAHYICRPRNNVKGAKVSEHGRGKAIDISGFTFADGSTWSVAGDYNKQLRKAHKAACGIFGTTLGPGSDGHHEDHFHFDTASYRSGPYCR